MNLNLIKSATQFIADLGGMTEVLPCHVTMGGSHRLGVMYMREFVVEHPISCVVHKHHDIGDTCFYREIFVLGKLPSSYLLNPRVGYHIKGTCDDWFIVEYERGAIDEKIESSNPFGDCFQLRCWDLRDRNYATVLSARERIEMQITRPKTLTRHYFLERNCDEREKHSRHANCACRPVMEYRLELEGARGQTLVNYCDLRHNFYTKPAELPDVEYNYQGPVDADYNPTAGVGSIDSCAAFERNEQFSRQGRGLFLRRGGN